MEEEEGSSDSSSDKGGALPVPEAAQPANLQPVSKPMPAKTAVAVVPHAPHAARAAAAHVVQEMAAGSGAGLTPGSKGVTAGNGSYPIPRSKGAIALPIGSASLFGAGSEVESEGEGEGVARQAAGVGAVGALPAALQATLDAARAQIKREQTLEGEGSLRLRLAMET